MKCKAFASQLEAHVGQSSVRGGEAIKTDRKALNNLISRVKNTSAARLHPLPTLQQAQNRPPTYRS